MTAQDLVQGVVAGFGLRAGAFIVTLFGDVVEPRGGRLATSDLIAACERVGLNAAQVRTAVSRLVAAGRLVGGREGRRSHYRLTAAAGAEFAAAARAIFGSQRPSGFAFVWAPAEADLSGLGARRIGPEFWLAPRPAAADGRLVFAAEAPPGPQLLALARTLWPLDACEAAYADFEARFSPLSAAPHHIENAAALTLRLLLTHGFRAAALSDPQLPEIALPRPWRGHSARQLFARLYLALSPAAEAAISQKLSDDEAPLPAATAASRARAAALLRSLD